MVELRDISDPAIVAMLQAGKVGVIRTDTLYGLVCQAGNEQAVERVYRLKGRDDHKSPVVLVASIGQLFDVPTDIEKMTLEEHWPGKVSVILSSQEAPVWIRRDNASVAYRLPDDEKLRKLLFATGPLIAPSANPQGESPAMDIAEAKAYFGAEVDFYIDGGRVGDALPSRLLRVNPDGTTEQLR